MRFYRLVAVMICLSVSSSAVYADDNTAEIQFSGVLVDPPACALSNDGVIRVSFDSVDVDTVDGQQNMQTIPVELKCTGGTANAFDLTLTVTGQTVEFGDADDNATLSTPQNPDLGIRMLMNAQPLKINEAVTGLNEDSFKTLQAVLVRRAGATLEPGDFTGTATLRAAYQ